MNKKSNAGGSCLAIREDSGRKKTLANCSGGVLFRPFGLFGNCSGPLVVRFLLFQRVKKRIIYFFLFSFCLESITF